MESKTTEPSCPSPHSSHSAWVEAVVGRDWEIFWNDDNDEGESDPALKVKNGAKDATETSSVVDSDNAEKEESTSTTISVNLDSNGETPRDAMEEQSTAKPSPDAARQKSDASSSSNDTKESNDCSQGSNNIPASDETATEFMETEETEKSPHYSNEGEADADEEMSGEEDGDEEDDDKVVHEDGWYLGRIEEFIGDNDEEVAIFKIRFVGDEESYEMPLRQEHVRPCNQRWIIRSLALLQLMDPQTADALPPATNLPRDMEALSSIRKQIENVSLPVFTKAFVQENGSSSTELSFSSLFSEERIQALQRLVCLVEEQIYLRSMLGPVEEDELDAYEYDTGCETEPSPPSEAYINHLVQSLKEVKDACAWVEQAYRLLARVYGDSSEDDGRVTRETLLEVGLRQGQTAIEILSQMDLLNCPNRKKRKRSIKSPGSPEKPASRRLQNRNKRQRIEALYQNDSASTSSNHTALQSPALELQPQDLWVSTDVVAQYLRRVLPDKLPWYFRAVADMFRTVDTQLVERVRIWEQNAEVYLGRRERINENSSAETAIQVDVGSAVSDTMDGEEDIPFVSYQDILTAVEATDTDPILSRFDFSAHVPELRRKLLDIVEFEVQTLREIGRVFEDMGHLEADTDPILSTLRCHFETANDPKSKVGNIHPLGRPSTDLTREMIENAIVYRLWYLDMVYVESTRERVDFVESVVSRLTRLPPLQSSVVRSPSECTFDLNLTLDAIAPRVHALSRRPVDNFVIFNRYKTALTDRQGTPENYKWLEAKLDLEKALVDLSQASVLSIPEEMILCRRDVINWLRSAENMLSNERPPFEEVERLHNDLETLLRGRSPARSKVVKDLRPSAYVDSEIKSFVLADLEPFKDGYLMKVKRLFLLGNTWKSRYESIRVNLLSHGNHNMSGTEIVPKNASMVDLKRIEDLVTEYEKLPVLLSTECSRLKAVHSSATQWAEMVQKKLGSDLAFDDALTFVDRVNAEDLRPRGVILHPTRQNLNSLSDLLRWHKQVRAWLGGSELYPRPYDLMAEGAEIIEAFSAMKKGDAWYQPQAVEIADILSSKISSQKSKRSLSVQKIQSNPLVASILRRLFDRNEEAKLNFPLGHLLFFVWELNVEKLLHRVKHSAKGTIAVNELMSIDQVIPTFDKTIVEKIDSNVPESPRKSLHLLVESYQEKIELIRDAYSKSKSLQRDCIRNPDEARSHFSVLKEIQSFLKGNQLAVDRDIELQLEREIKLFSWMTRALEYHVLRSDDLPAEADETTESDDDIRIQWETLLKLNDSQPPLAENETGGLAALVMRVRELHHSASSWQEEISSFTQLSLRGGKRRDVPTKGEADADESERVDLEKLTDLCTHPVLDKVAMPREAAVQSMLEYTEEFENRLFKFLGKDYEGDTPDRAPYPRGSSLIEDGHFIPFRLTGSSLYHELKREIAEIDSIVSNVLAETPGKAAFEWISKAVEWIDSLNTSFSRDKSGKISLEGDVAKTLISSGEEVLLDVPDDLRRTMSHHGIFISTQKTGKITVKSKKKGAQYAVGTTMIRWCPILFDALKADLNRCNRWEAKFRSLAEEYKTFQETYGDAVNEEAVMQCHMFFQEMTDLQHESLCLVVSPQGSMVGYVTTFIHSLDHYLQAHSSPELKEKAADIFYKDAKNVMRMRDVMRDSLLDRLMSVGGALASSFREEKFSLPFRFAARTVLKKALNTTADKLDLQVSGAAVTSLCEVKAFEIENALFQRFQGTDGAERITPEYRQQALTLKRSLGDIANIVLCLKVLTGRIDAEEVANMPSEKLANPQLRTEREQAEDKAKKGALLTGSASKTHHVPRKSIFKKKTAGKTLGEESGGPLRDSGKTQSALKDPSDSLKSLIPKSDAGGQLKIGNDPRGASPNTNDLRRTTRSAGHSSLPPSIPVLAGQKKPVSAVRWAVNVAGSEQFQFALANNSRKFRAGLVAEEQAGNDAVPLPEKLVEKGRLAVKSFSDFVRTKVGGGKWELRKYRIISDTETDEKELHKFCKDYEVKKRLSMLTLDGGNKLFVIPPKFHGAAKSLVNFQMEEIVYAVLLFRK
eukprot:scaffold1071_cov166-Amphora_coffeaeformis.AAC.19